MELRQVIRALRRNWWLPAVGLLLGGAAAWGLCALQTPLYTSETQLFVSTTDSASTSDAFQGGQFSQERVASYAQLLVGEELAGRIVDRLDLSMSPEDLAEEITANSVSDTVLLDVAVTDPSPERARQIARAIGTEFPQLVEELESPGTGAPAPIRVTVTDRPDLPAQPSAPDVLRNVSLGVLLGLLLGAVTAIVRAQLDRSVRETEGAAEAAGAPVIALVMRDDWLGKRHTIDRGANHRTAEDFRQLRTNLQFLNVDEPPKVIMVTSAVPSEGKTTTSINLALALAETGRRVTLVEADLRRPKVTQYLGLIEDVGLTNVLAGTAAVGDVVQHYRLTSVAGSAVDEVVPTYRQGFEVLAAGPTPPNPGDLLASRHMVALIEKLREENDYVLVDSPPLLPVADAVALSAIMDGVLLSVRYGSTRKDQLRQAAASLERVGATVLGVVLNIVPPNTETASAYGYGHNYGYEAGRRPTSGSEVAAGDLAAGDRHQASGATS